MSNNHLKRTLEFDVTDAPILAHALAIAACTAMMCGHPDAQKRMRQYQEFIKQIIPPEVAMFDEEEWCEIGIALAQAKAFHVCIAPTSWERGKPYIYDGLVTIRIGERVWQDNRMLKRSREGDPMVEQVYNVLVQIAPMDCKGTFSTEIEKVSV